MVNHTFPKKYHSKNKKNKLESCKTGIKLIQNNNMQKLCITAKSLFNYDDKVSYDDDKVSRWQSTHLERKHFEN